jgi:hypothetical protein
VLEKLTPAAGHKRGGEKVTRSGGERNERIRFET